MKKHFSAGILLGTVLLSLLLFQSCERLHIGIGHVKNNTKSDLAGAEWDESLPDSVLCHDMINLDYYLQPGLSEDLLTRPDKGNLRELPDSAKQYIYIFNLDSLNKYKKLQICEGIVKRCLVKRIEIQLNKVKEPFDTVFINSSTPLN